MTPRKNYVYVKFNISAEEHRGGYVNKGNLIIPTDHKITGAHKTKAEGDDYRKNAVTFGTVIAFTGLDYREEHRSDYDLDFDTEPELEVGDQIIWDYKEYHEAERNKRINFEDMTAFIHYSKVYVRIRGGEVTPVNGYLLVEPLNEVKKSALELDKISETRGVIRYAGSPVHYRQHIYQETDDEFAPVLPPRGTEIDVRMPTVGDIVIFKDYNARDVQDWIHNVLGKRFYAMQRRDVSFIAV